MADGAKIKYKGLTKSALELRTSLSGTENHCAAVSGGRKLAGHEPFPPDMGALMAACQSAFPSGRATIRRAAMALHAMDGVETHRPLLHGLT
jgi:hypothetical protein